MIKEFYNCDAGSIAILCGESIICFPNSYGDGCFKVYSFKNEDEFSIYKNEHLLKYAIDLNSYKFITSCRFKNAQVLDYDCLKLEEITDGEILFELTGRYAIYEMEGKFFFVKWSE